MRKLILLTFLLLIVVFCPARADDDDYRLRQPDAEAYLRAVPHAIEIGDLQIPQTIRHELEQFGDLGQYPFEVLFPVYHVLEPVSLREQDFNRWPEWLVFAWLRDNNINLADYEQITFEDYTINITPVDFNDNGQDEWVFDIDSELYSAFWIIARDVSSPSGYWKVETPISYSFAAYCPSQLGCGGRGAILGIQDVNADSLPELLISMGSCGYGICGAWLAILAWRDGEMVDLSETATSRGPSWEMVSGGGGAQASPPDGTWTFENIDDDAPLELVQSGTIDGSMDCIYHRYQLFDWNTGEDRYFGGDEVVTYDESSGCFMRQAHLALRDINYADGIVNYEHLLEMLPDDADDELLQYIRLRLASAYALYDRGEDAMALLITLSEEVPATSLMDNMITSAYEAYRINHNPIMLCSALYQSLLGYEYWRDDESQILQFGQINDYGIPSTYGGGDFSPANSGCNLRDLLQVDAGTLTQNDPSPADQLSELGWQILKTFHADLSGDSIDDWLIWVDGLENEALLLISHNGQYQVTQAYLSRYDELSIYQPSASTQPLLASLSTGSEGYGDCPIQQQIKLLTFYRLDITDRFYLDNVWHYNYVICGEQSLGEIFTDDSTFTAWSFPSEPACNLGIREEVTYGWDEDAQQFVQDTHTPCTQGDEAIVQEGTTFTCGTLGKDLCVFYVEGQDAIDAIDALRAQPPDFADENFFMAMSYHRARALESLNRLDEALAEYVAIYDTAPESAWGMLAALHFEPID